MFSALKQLAADLRFALRPHPPAPAVSLQEINKTAGLLLRACRTTDAARKARYKAALAHVRAAQALAQAGCPARLVNAAANRAVAAMAA